MTAAMKAAVKAFEAEWKRLQARPKAPAPKAREISLLSPCTYCGGFGRGCTRCGKDE